MFSAKGYSQTGVKKFLWLKKLKAQYRVISNLNGDEIVGSFFEKEFQKTNQKEFRIKEVIKKKGS